MGEISQALVDRLGIVMILPGHNLIDEARRDDVERDYIRWRGFCEAWRDVGRPFFKCTYCCGVHFRPEMPGTPCCTEEKFVRGLIYKFPMLRRQAPGLAPWNPTKWARWWRTSGAQTGGSYHVVAFVLSVWSGGNRSNDGKRWIPGYDFDLVRALQTLDEAHRRVIQEWIANPWWP